jgi:hypothetical protein
MALRNPPHENVKQNGVEGQKYFQRINKFNIKRTKFILRIKEQETRLNLLVHDDDDDDDDEH